MNRKLAFSLLLGAFTLASWAQQAMTVKGTVKDSENNPVIGATVVIKGTTQGTTTDIDGNYTIQAEPGQVLEFSYVGMQPSTVTVGNRNEINITMADGELLDEVVVIGYGTVKKSHLTGAVASVSGKELQASVARSASSALQGRIAGVTVSTPNGQPGEGMNINIRGISSMSSTTPLYVIDGVYGDINMVDPSDIQSLEVLKDASAASIYGSRAANGVVLITTKGGRLETPTRISVDAYTGIQSVAKYIDVMDGNQLRDFAKMTGYSTADELVNWSGGKGTDWQKELYGTAMVSKVGLNVSGGNKTSTYNLSGSYLKQDGIVKTTGYEAWNIRAKNTFSLFNNHVRMGSTIMMKFWQKDKESVSFTSPLTAVPMWKPYNEDGSWGQAPTWTRGDNPVGWAEAYDIQNHGTDILLNGFAEVDLGLKGLKYKFNVGINKYTRR
ncbi:SusC/RagA family TonB-linked outer membrane protein, partial [uncultured Parabacteroides sp.]